jgi:hypothetical protein
MSNHFPPPPDDLSLISITYTTWGLPGDGLAIVSGSPFWYAPPVAVLLDQVQPGGSQGLFTVNFSYDDAGAMQYGDFDQDAVETEVTAYLDATYASIATITGMTVAALQSAYPVTVLRSWTYQSYSTSAQLELSTNYPYPAAA